MVMNIICIAAAVALGCTLAVPGASFAAGDKDKSATSAAKPSKATAHQKKPKKGWSNQLPSQTNGAPPNWSITPSPTFPRRPSQSGTGTTVP
jgi:hypothetical protein